MNYPAEFLVLFKGIHRVFRQFQMNGAGKSVSADEAVKSGFTVQKILHIYQLQQELFILRFQPGGELLVDLANVSIEVLEDIAMPVATRLG